MESKDTGLIIDVVAILNKELQVSYTEKEIKIIFNKELNEFTTLIELFDKTLIKFELSVKKEVSPYFIIGALMGLNIHIKEILIDKINSISLNT